MDDLKNKLLVSYSIYNQYNEYYNMLYPLLTDKYDSEMTAIKKHMSHAKLSNELMVKLFINDVPANVDKKINRLIDIYEKAYESNNSFKRVMSIMGQSYLQPMNILSTMSQTRMMDTQDIFRELKLKYTRFANVWESLEVELIELLSRELMSIIEQIPDKYTVAVQLQSKFRRSPSIIHLYTRIIQDIVDRLYADDKLDMIRVLKLIDDDKDYYLISDEKYTSKKDIHLTNPPINKFNLLPVTESMPMDKLMSVIIPKQTNGKISMEIYAKSNLIGFIVMNRIVYHPMEYTIRGILDSENKTLVQPPEYGVNLKVVDRFTNIKQLADEAKWNFTSNIIGDPDKMKAYYILETLDGTGYRAMAPWFSSNTYYVPISKILDLLEYLTTDNKPTRISAYQKLKTHDAIGNMFLKKRVDLTLLTDKSMHIDIQQIQNALYESIMSVVRRDINDSYNNGFAVMNNTHMNMIIHNTHIRDMFYRIVLQKYTIGTELTKAQKYSAGDFPFSELLCTYIKELRYITNRFMKELHNGYNRNPLNDTVFTQPKKEMKKTIIDKIEEIIEKAIQITLHHKTNIYSDMTYKYFLLNYVNI
jgi:hypothetical protein